MSWSDCRKIRSQYVVECFRVTMHEISCQELLLDTYTWCLSNGTFLTLFFLYLECFIIQKKPTNISCLSWDFRGQNCLRFLNAICACISESEIVKIKSFISNIAKAVVSAQWKKVLEEMIGTTKLLVCFRWKNASDKKV